MTVVYSTRLFSLPGVSGLVPTAYTVPAGKLTVVRCIVASIGATIIGGAVRVLDSFGSAIFTFPRSNGPAGDETQVTEMRLVYYAGDALSVEVTGVTADVIAMGYELITP